MTARKQWPGNTVGPGRARAGKFGAVNFGYFVYFGHFMNVQILQYYQSGSMIGYYSMNKNIIKKSLYINIKISSKSNFYAKLLEGSSTSSLLSPYRSPPRCGDRPFF